MLALAVNSACQKFLAIHRVLAAARRQMATFITDGALDTNRTCDPPLRRGMLYPLSYEGICAVFVLSGKILREIASGNE